MTGPKIKFTKEKILDGALNFIAENGINNLSARNLATYIHSSTQPIFRVFSNFEELIFEVKQRIYKKQDNYVYKNAKNYQDTFLGIGISYITFARDYPNLFYVIFLDNFYSHNKFEDFFKDDDTQEIIRTLEDNLNLDNKNATKLFRNTWLLTHGMACLIYTGQVKYDDEEIIDILKTGFNGTLLEIRGDKSV